MPKLTPEEVEFKRFLKTGIARFKRQFELDQKRRPSRMEVSRFESGLIEVALASKKL